jgi:quercetin dioxygenase-like cupin family protein
MRRMIILAACLAAPVTSAYADGMTKPKLILEQAVKGLPEGSPQDVRVLAATFAPGSRTVTHTHRYPVTVYILAGAFTLEVDGHDPVTVKGGEAYVEPPNVRMTGYNRSASEETKVVIFYVSPPETPFLDPVK